MTDTPIRTAQEMMEDAIEALLRNAYRQGAEDVHREWSEYEGDFGEAADDYAKSVGIEAVLTALSDRIQPTTLPDPEAIALPTEWELVALIERTLDVHDDWNIPPSHSVARAILALMKGEG